MTRTRLHRHGTLERENFPVQDISDYVTDPACTVWLDVHDPASSDFDMITEEFGLHALAVEDATYEHQRPKLDTYRTHLFSTHGDFWTSPGVIIGCCVVLYRRIQTPRPDLIVRTGRSVAAALTRGETFVQRLRP